MKMRTESGYKLLVLAAVVISAGALSAADGLLVNGAGATFPYPIYAKWFDAFHKAQPDVNINYQSIGSGGGIRQLLAGTVDFGASDKPMDDGELSKAPFKVLHFPTVLGAVVPTYNVPGVSSDLKFTPEALAGAFSGKIKKWNDPEIAKANPGVSLPDKEIVIVHRSDGSGTTFVFTDYLSKVNSDWKTAPGSAASINWPVGLGAKGNEGIAGLVKQTPNSLGYVELIYAAQNKMSFGSVKNSSGAFIKADLSSVTAAADGAAKSMPDDFRVSITNAPGKTAYPISTFTWLLIPETIKDGAKKAAITNFLKWMLVDGQKSVEALSYAPLPKSVVAKELKAISLVK